MNAAHIFKNKMASASGKVTQVASNIGGGTQALTPINGGTATAPVGGLHHLCAAALDSQYSVQTKSMCEHDKDDVSDPELYISSLLTCRRPGI